MAIDQILFGAVMTLAVFAAAAVILGRLYAALATSPAWLYRIALGATLGMTSVACMHLPFELSAGAQFDGRGVAIAAAGLFGGPIGAVSALWPPVLYQLTVVGGSGVTLELVQMALAGGLGIATRFWALRDASDVQGRHIFVSALFLPFSYFLAVALSPSFGSTWSALQGVGPAVALKMPLGLLALGMLIRAELNRHATLDTLERRQSLIDAVHSDVPAMLWQRRVGPDGALSFNFVSRSARRILDLDPEEIYADAGVMTEVVHPDDRGMFTNRLKVGETEGRLPNARFRIVAKDGAVRWVQSSAVAMRLRDGFVWNGVTTDVTDAVNAESRLRTLGDIIDELPTPVIHTDAQLNILLFNKAASELYGYAQEEAIGASAGKFRPPERVEFMAPFLAERIRTQTPGVVETDGLHKSGERIPVRLEFNPLLSETDELIGWSCVSLDQRERRHAVAELERMATTDALTGLSNRRTFEARSTEEIARSIRHGRPLAVIMADIDHFKQVNDTYGHVAGDKVLTAFAELLSTSMRGGGDLVARTGGEEFAMLLPDCDADGAERFAERLRAVAAAYRTSHDGQIIQVTASFGVAQWAPAEETLEPAIKRADDALYRAKEGGRDRVCRSDGGLRLLKGGVDAKQSTAIRPA